MGTGMKCLRLGEEGKYTVDTNSCRCGNRGSYKFPFNLVPNGVVSFQIILVHLSQKFGTIVHILYCMS